MKNKPEAEPVAMTTNNTKSTSPKVTGLFLSFFFATVVTAAMAVVAVVVAAVVVIMAGGVLFAISLYESLS